MLSIFHEIMKKEYLITGVLILLFGFCLPSSAIREKSVFRNPGPTRGKDLGKKEHAPGKDLGKKERAPFQKKISRKNRQKI